MESEQSEANQFIERGQQELRSKGTIKLNAGYHVSKWIIMNRMKIELERKRKEDEDLKARGILHLKKDEEEMGVDAYWSTCKPEYRHLTDQQVRAVAIMQIYFKTMIQITRARKSKKAGMGLTVKITLCQSAIRRFFARREAREREAIRRNSDKAYAEFCKRMSEDGFEVNMFSKKYGTAVSRTLKFDSDCKNIIYKSAPGLFSSTREIDIKTIYQVNKGMSRTSYPKARPKRAAYTFHLALLGEKFCDFEASSGQECKQLLFGFSRLRLLACTSSCFFFDKSGVPSRAVGSNVTYSIEDKGYKSGKQPKSTSEADLMRFKYSCRILQGEYNKWTKQMEKEKEEFDRAQAKLLEEQAAFAERVKKDTEKAIAEADAAADAAAAEERALNGEAEDEDEEESEEEDSDEESEDEESEDEEEDEEEEESEEEEEESEEEEEGEEEDEEEEEEEESEEEDDS